MAGHVGPGESLSLGVPPHPGPGPACRALISSLQPHAMWQSFTVLTAWAVKPALSQLKAFFVRRWKKPVNEENERAQREQGLEYLPLGVHTSSTSGKGETPPLTPSGLCQVFALILSLWGCRVCPGVEGEPQA